jgi:hypothetical protein
MTVGFVLERGIGDGTFRGVCLQLDCPRFAERTLPSHALGCAK